MSATIQSVDLGNVLGAKGDIGATGQTGPAGADGQDGKTMLYGQGDPASNLGNDGDVYLDAESGTFYSKESGAWSPLATFALEGAVVDEELDDESENPVQNKAIAAGISAEAEARHAEVVTYANSQTEEASANITATKAVTVVSGTRTAYKKGQNGEAIINTTDSWPFRTGNAPYVVPSGFRPKRIVLSTAIAVVGGRSGIAAISINEGGELRVASPLFANDGGVIASGTCTSFTAYVHYGI